MDFVSLFILFVLIVLLLVVAGNSSYMVRTEVLSKEYVRLCKQVNKGKKSVLDGYEATLTSHVTYFAFPATLPDFSRPYCMNKLPIQPR